MCQGSLKYPALDSINANCFCKFSEKLEILNMVPSRNYLSAFFFFFFLMPDVGANQFQPRRSPYSSSKQPHVPLTPTAHSSPGLAAPHFNVFSPQPPQATAFCNLYLSCPPPRVIPASRSPGDVVPPRRTARGSEPSPSNYWFWS